MCDKIFQGVNIDLAPWQLSNLLIGFAIGDAFGAGVEFQDRHWIRQHLDFTTFINARDKINISKKESSLFTHNYTPWDYTDDTEMTIGVIKALSSNEVFSEALLIDKWEAEYKNGIYQKGYGRNGHGSMRWYYDGEKTIEEIKDFQRGRPNPGNAPAMRSVPLGFVSTDRINDYAAINANATHPNLQAILSSQCIARATEYLLVKKGNPKLLIPYCLQTIPFNKDYVSYLTQIDHLVSYEQLREEDYSLLCGPQPIQVPYFLAGIRGLPSDSKYTAACVLYVLKHASDPFDALKKSILMGGDVDSLAAICTGIMAYKHGIESLPKYMLEQVEGLPYLRSIAIEFEQYIIS